MAYTFDDAIISDLHKDARGFRPREYFWAEWNNSTDPERQAIWDRLCKELEDEVTRERKEQALANTRFEELVQATLGLGAGDQATAIRWIIEGEGFDTVDLQYGADYIAYHFGLAYDNAYRVAIQNVIDQIQLQQQY